MFVFRNDMPEDEYNLMKEETVDQIKEFSDTLDRMQKGDISLNNKLSMLKAVWFNEIISDIV